MDVFSEPDPETYKIWQIFAFPSLYAGTKTAIAVPAFQGSVISALYTILSLGIFNMAWIILLSLVLIFCTPKKMTRTTYIAIVAVWNANDAWVASLLILNHAAGVFRGALSKSYPGELTWKAFGFDIILGIISVGNLSASIILGLLFPSLLIIGYAAPANERIVYYPKNDPTASTLSRFQKLQYHSMGALRAVGSIEGSEVTIRKRVNLRSGTPSMVNNEKRYNISYGYTVYGTEMGLQQFGHLGVTVDGFCEFENDWYNKTSPQHNSSQEYEWYNLWPDLQAYPFIDSTSQRPEKVELLRNTAPYALFDPVSYRSGSENEITGWSYYVIVPATAGKVAANEGTDAWYATESTAPGRGGGDSSFKFQVKRGRPPLRCRQRDTWFYESWNGTMKNLLSDNEHGPPVRLPPAIAHILREEFSVPMIVNIGQSLNAGALKSATRLLHRDNALDAETAAAEHDMLRLALAAFIATRHIFRDVAMGGIVLGRGEGNQNALVDADGTKMEGSADFVIESNAVWALRLGYVIVVPALLLFLTILRCLLEFGKRAATFSTTTNPGRFSRYVMFIVGLQATQLYRMVDQILGAVEVVGQDESIKKEHELQAKQAHWRGQTSLVPFVAPFSPSQETQDTLVLPQMQVTNTPLKQVATPRNENGKKDDNYLILATAPQPRKKVKPASDPSAGGGEEEKKTQDTPNLKKVSWSKLSEQDGA
ncbi:hypothetical protein BDZ91DRAFT_737501 [Kalaharituber pfeilii]|nr:hypothetical protein BDZ91DRAFT_737501 [Kalaharituber pfeilii]